MALQHEIFNFLTGFPTVNAIVGKRIYPLVITQGTSTPAVAWRTVRIFGEPELDDARETIVTLELTTWGKTYVEADDSARVIQQAIDGFVAASGGDLTIGDTAPQSILLQREEDVYDEDLALCGRQQFWEFQGMNL